MASFGRPVVPDVQSQKPGESSQVAYGSPSAGSAPSTASKLAAVRRPSAGSGPSPTTMTCASSGARSTRSEVGRDARSAETATTRRPGLGDREPEIGGGQQRVQRQRDSADPHRGEEGDDELDAVEQHERHALLGPHAESPQAARRAADEVVQLRVRDAAALGAAGHAPAVAGCQPTVDQVRGRVEGLYGVLPGALSPARSRAAPAALPSPARRPVPARGRGRHRTRHGRPRRR